MKMADVLRDLADKIDGMGQGEETASPANTGPTADHFHHEVNDGAESGDKDVDVSAVMIPPLQQKLEILKKTAGMDNAFDDHGSDELDDIKKLTGVKAVIGHVASEDNDITG